ncbi:MAG: hypothetical protein HQL70_01800 [Magnetococcales bacterium]|nr:hypothetical protein [Magnetococcales bacterium]
MKVEEVIGLLAVVFIFGLIGAAMLPEDMWEDHSRTPGMGGVLQGVIGIAPTGSSSRVASPLQGVAVAAVTPQPNTNVDQKVPRTTIAQPGLIPFSRAPLVRFAGTIQQITELQQRDGQIHLWVTDNVTGNEHEVSVAPSWYLKYMNCTLLHDMDISGVGFQFDKKKGSSIIYAKKIKIKNQPCHLRNDEGFALWSNRLR